MREKILSAYSDAAKAESYTSPTLNFETVMHHLLSNSSYMPKGQDVRLRKKVLPILTGCINTLSAALHADNVQQTLTTTLPATQHAESVQQNATTTIGQDISSSLNPPLPGGSYVGLYSTM